MVVCVYHIWYGVHVVHKNLFSSDNVTAVVDSSLFVLTCTVAILYTHLRYDVSVHMHMYISGALHVLATELYLTL